MGFKKIIDIDKVESISFDGCEIKLRNNDKKVSYQKFSTHANFTLDAVKDIANYIVVKERIMRLILIFIAGRM